MLEFITFIQNLVKNSTNINFGREIGLNFNQKVFLVLIEWFRFIWPFITDGRQYNQAFVTHSKVTTIT